MKYSFYSSQPNKFSKQGNQLYLALLYALDCRVIFLLKCITLSLYNQYLETSDFWHSSLFLFKLYDFPQKKRKYLMFFRVYSWKLQQSNYCAFDDRVYCLKLYFQNK